jgi:hypothetical protein
LMKRPGRRGMCPAGYAIHMKATIERIEAVWPSPSRGAEQAVRVSSLQKF